jgi:mono/diheme cytochrome c family protein
MTFHRAPLSRILICMLLPLASAAAQAQAQPQSRGSMLYSTHCIECHTTQMHWRANKQARDWDTLRAQVRRWQQTAGLGWSDSDIDDVARHLNETIYHFPQGAARASRD